MTDPLDDLREPVRPVAPDPAFAARLRARLERAVLHPNAWENAMPTASAAPSTAESLALHTVTPYLTVPDAAVALAFYADAFGGVRRGEPIRMPDGRIGHAEIALGDSVLMLAEEFPDLGLVAPARGAVTQSLRLEVADPDAVVDRAVTHGARLERPVADSPYGRGGVVVDPTGHRWMVSRETAVLRPGDVGYASLWTSDAAAAAQFYGAVLGWTAAAPHGSAPAIVGGQDRRTAFCCYAVADVDAAVELVRAAGGTAAEPTVRPYGRVADCVDDQGLRFAVFTPPAGTLALDIARPGALTSLAIEVPDTGRARAFYGTVLGWGFAPGPETGAWIVRIDDRDSHPTTGVADGRDPVIVPTFAVADIAAAVAAVRTAGGTAEEPAFAGSDTYAACVDDQGCRFSLVQY
ncbi:VOC family protein [Pseudonocardia asaccharolytica]|uniref:Glyoxalase n=1 Tax=Pseudonocardia asaccharolytica DSM 44247 = NBRC 16224 TaxID=1123024 RepID=A0A511CZC8_9PSEU|nr:VOC family protein [Pseudonocardia asaccharolytica]GEL17900.1 glyoxalase [Pseudonocardia asaccharolytica DSM 44247 = NBRC 16224]